LVSGEARRPWFLRKNQGGEPQIGLVTVYTTRSSGASPFEILREEVPLQSLLKETGQGKATCVAHDDKNPSMHLYDNHVHCFACGFHGDVVDVWSSQKGGFDRPIDAALDLAKEFNVTLPEMNEEARKAVAERREKQDEYLRIAHERREDMERTQAKKAKSVRKWWDDRGFDAGIRNRFLLGVSASSDPEAIIPFWYRGRVQGLIRRKLEGNPKYRYPAAEEFVGGYRPLFVPGPIRGEVFLVEGVLDAIAIVAAGGSAIAIGGSGISVQQRNDLERLTTNSKIYILPDNDDEGSGAAAKWARHLYPRAEICQPDYKGSKDAADLFQQVGADATLEHLSRLAASATDLLEAETTVAKEIEGSARKRLAYVTEIIIPLVARISPESVREATLDIIASDVPGVKVTWLRKALKEEQARLQAGAMEEMGQMIAEEQERLAEEHLARVEKAQDDIDGLLSPGVLTRLRKDAAAVHNVKRDQSPLDLALLVALGAQLAPLPNGRPLGASILLTAEPGRGKNHVVDAACELLPEEFYFAFEIASGQSLYYKADEDPDFLRHTFAYPNEIEGAEALWEFLRPMLSKGRATKIVTAKDMDGNMTTRTIVVEGPVTIAIPTIRNKTDDQLQTRLLLAELPDFPGRVKEHSEAISEQLHPDFALKDFSYERFIWVEGLRQLTEIRRVVFPLRSPGFALDDDKVSHGARMWANLLGLMSAHAWLEQKNRTIIALESGEEAIVATPDDYDAAYQIFTEVCKRTVINLSGTHRKILGSLYDIMQEFPNREGFTTREIADGAGVSPQTVSNNKTFLVQSAKLVRDTEHGLVLVPGAEPGWWAEGDLTAGLPTPKKVRAWWNEGGPPDPQNGGHAGQAPRTGSEADTYGGNSVQWGSGQAVDVSSLVESTNGHHPTGHVQPVSSGVVDSEISIDKPKSQDQAGLSSLSSGFGAKRGLFSEDEPELGDDPGVEI